ncbi:MAG: pseudouridine-5'-phosphate glycosidase [Bacilli bacterium]|nr:pseudouridine-5'-phosphate glycosidase [Bacilli bacterium]
MKISKEVQEAIKLNKPVVALESTIISHGMPYPKNVECALLVEKTIRENGAIPATIGIIEGEPIIGMSPEEIEEFGKRKGIVKCSRRDLPIVFAKKMWGATTVSATMILAEKASIEFFVTGGIGGVHKGATETFDISADLDELGKTNVSVICAGPKAILDLGLTLEYLETKGVPVIGFNSDKLPAFYTRTSEFNVLYNAKNPAEIAQIVKSKREYELNGGVLVCNPVPEEYSMDSNYINEIIEKALIEMKENGIVGKEQTPFLLSKIVELTGGESLETNIKLILNNAKLGAQIALEYSKIGG